MKAKKAPAIDRPALAEHPRFGTAPRLTGLDPVNTADGSVFLHWHSPTGVRVPNTAVAADLAHQAPATVAVTHYFDSRRVCRVCRAPFLFFADEQKYWYERLGFPLEADCLECVACRKDLQRLRVARKTYERLLGSPSRSADETLALVECAVVLVESSVFSKQLLPKLRGLLNPVLAEAQGSHHAQALSLRARLAELAAR